MSVDPPFFERVKQIGESVVACFIDSQVRFRPRHFFPVESLAEGEFRLMSQQEAIQKMEAEDIHSGQIDLIGELFDLRF